MEKEKTKFTLRIEAETLHKFHYAAKRNLRPVNKELENILKKHIEKYNDRKRQAESLLLHNS